jgi:hypothetical protein
VEAVMLAIFCLVCWKIGWTKAPRDENLCVVLYNSYEVEEIATQEQELAVEVVLGSGDNAKPPNDLIFQQHDDQYGPAYLVDSASLESKVQAHNGTKQTPVEKRPPGLDDDDAGVSPRPIVPPTDERTISSEDDSTNPQQETGESSSQQISRVSHTLAVLKGRAQGYRQTIQVLPETQADIEEEPPIHSVVDERGEEALEEYEPTAAGNYHSVPSMTPEKRKDDQREII